MTTPPEAPGAPHGAADRAAVTVAAVVAGALLLVLLIVGWAGHPHAPFAPTGDSFRAVESAVAAAGLQVCTGVEEPDPRANQAVASRTYTVAVRCPGPDALVVVDRFADVAHRDATARELTARTRPRGSGVVYTLGDSTVFVAGSGADDVQQRLDAGLRAAGAR